MSVKTKPRQCELIVQRSDVGPQYVVANDALSKSHLPIMRLGSRRRTYEPARPDTIFELDALPIQLRHCQTSRCSSICTTTPRDYPCRLEVCRLTMRTIIRYNISRSANSNARWIRNFRTEFLSTACGLWTDSGLIFFGYARPTVLSLLLRC